MTLCSIPTCYFPSTVVFVDDSQDFLINFTLQLGDELAYRLFNSPHKALDAINLVHQDPNPLNQRCISEEKDENVPPVSSQTINIDLAAIHWEVYNPQRFSEISVAVVDYAMPEMNGLEFCKALEESPVKKILLTGKADDKIVIEAFNRGIIHRFIPKHDPNVTELIKESIAVMQHQYFQDMSDMIVKMLAVNSPSCLTDKKFADFFKQICLDNQIVEFYLTENSGSFLLLDTNAEVSCLIVKSKQDLEQHHALAMQNNAPQDILDWLKTGSRIPYFWDAGGRYQSEWGDWSTCLHPAEKIEADEIYYYALVKGPSAFDIQQEKIVSFERYLKQQDIKSVINA